MLDRWFEIPGYPGHRRVINQLEGLTHVLSHAEGKRVLDLGCAEGLVGRRFALYGAGVVHGVEKDPHRVQEARRLNVDLPSVRVFEGDLEDPRKLWELEPRLRGRYDTVLALSILQKLREPEKVLSWMSEVAEEFIVIRTPDPVIRDERSFGKECDVGQCLQSFTRLTGKRNTLGAYVQTFVRTGWD